MVRLLLSLPLLFLLGGALAQPGYTVTAGDTLSGIARRFDTTVAVLQQLNALPGSTIRVGQRLFLPEKGVPLTAGYLRHTVEAGETMAQIAARYGVREDVLRVVNPEYRAGAPAGAVLRVPEMEGELVTVGDSGAFLRLSLERGLAPSALLQANGLPDISAVRAGQQVFVPGQRRPVPAGGPSTSVDAGGQGASRDRLLAQGRVLLAGAPELLSSFEASSLGYAWPLAVRGRISSSFGRRNISVAGNTFHGGVDIVAPPGTAIVAVSGGRVVKAGWSGAYGYAVYLDHSDGSQTRYAHMSAVSVTVGRMVGRGELLGHVGSTGASTGPHLHFELRFQGRAVDPLGYLTPAD